ncbi:putative MATE family efflux protein [Clostridium tetanomorphum]|uniref:Multidrug export protein MepA n=1 Tax=Clostridium tetanomorphum TaxID=1553 RepID=A0A923EB36_CLOTT|nr:MATE family efflux transporter [Clostridium tetanomorphum]KAJ51076.1 Na+ driven multidrug efflux protein [Clostridium tetanomorphum DSM 665]MBC2397996.1 MATE family efflux transporter [Clostridium tetanomorphum]MBP1864498.1 putative MATE family efflux protein [Clostridium tetanomorphum]NRS82971.1 putative MATE family efflux protein [Clostridium tetanomorphum]NRZ98933.1 putative MATE family efflux protein [Clostridium tetanomorphum]
MDRSKQLGEESVGKLLLKFSIPAIVGMLVNALYNMVDRIFIGQGVGSLAISGIAVGFPLSIINMAFGMLIGIGSSTMVSIKLGEKKKHEAEKILGNAIVLVIFVSLFISVFGLIFLESILRIFGASDATLPYARDYMKYIIGGALLQNIGFGINNIIRAEGNPKIAMTTMIIGAIINTILDPIFIFAFNMGVQGAAIATILSQTVSSTWVLYYFFSGKSSLKIRKENLHLNINTVKTIFSIGMSPFFMQLAASVVTTLYNNNLIKYGGDLAVGAMGIINSIIMLFFMPMFGINQGAQPIIGYNYGAHQYDRVKKTLKLAVTAGIAIATIGFIVIQCFPEFLISIFNKKDAELIKIGSHGIRIDMIAMPIIGFQIISSNYFQAIGKAKIAIFLSLSRQVILLIPMLIIFPPIFKLDGVWMAGPIADVLSATITAAFLYKDMKLLDKQEIVLE